MHGGLAFHIKSRQATQQIKSELATLPELYDGEHPRLRCALPEQSPHDRKLATWATHQWQRVLSHQSPSKKQQAISEGLIVAT